MPFPWKKNRVARISNFVADLHSPKRGGSLVVETGFPTSLIDLFVKNRSRFKKPNSKKRVPRETPDPRPPQTTTLPPEPSNSNERSALGAEPRYPEATSVRQLVGDDRKQKPKKHVHRENPDPTLAPAPEPSNSSDRTAPCAEPRYPEATNVRRLVGDDGKSKPKKRVHRETSDPTPAPAAEPPNTNNRTALCAEPRYAETPSLRRSVGDDRKPKPKKRVNRETPDPTPPTTTTTPEPSDSNDRMSLCAEPRHPEPPSLRRSVGVGDNRVSGSDRDIDGFSGSDSDPRQVITAILKTFLVLIVTFGMKKLTLGITISAFLLLFIEYAWKHVVSFLKPCSNANMAFKSFTESVSNCVSVRVSDDLESETVRGMIAGEEVELISGSSSMGEIGIAETKTEMYIPEKCEVSESKTRKITRSARFKSKIVKKLVPRKLLGSKKEKRIKERRTEPSSVQEDKSANSDIEEEEEEEEEKEDDQGVDYGGTTCSILEGDEEEKEEEREGKRRGNSESECMMMFMIALAGLVVSPLLALMLTVTWIFMAKMVKSPGRSLNVPPFMWSKQRDS